MRSVFGSDMGGRKGSSISVMAGGGGGVGSIHARHEIEHKLEKAPPKAVAEAAVAYIATTNPAVAALYIAYKVAKFAYPIVEKGVKTYERTGDKEKAIEKMKEETIKQTAKEVVSTAVSTVVGANVEHVEQVAGVTVDKATNTFVETAISETINETIT